MRKPFIAANWKMHKTVEDAVKFVEEVQHRLPSEDVLTFDHVSFRYADAQEDTLHDLDFSCKRGQQPQSSVVREVVNQR